MRIAAEQVKRGMVFGCGKERATAEFWRGERVWTSTTWTLFEPHAWDLLGCDPTLAARSDCEQYGIAPGFDAGAHGFARTREGGAVDMWRADVPIGGVCGRPDGTRYPPRNVGARMVAGNIVVGLDARYASPEDVRRLCCGAPAVGKKHITETGKRDVVCTLAIGDHDTHEDIASGVKWPAKESGQRCPNTPAITYGIATALPFTRAELWTDSAAWPLRVAPFFASDLVVPNNGGGFRFDADGSGMNPYAVSGKVEARGFGLATADSWRDYLTDAPAPAPAAPKVSPTATRDAAVAKAVADVPKGCSAAGWRNVVHALAADAEEHAPRTAWWNQAWFHPALYGHTVAAYERERRAGYGKEQAAERVRDATSAPSASGRQRGRLERVGIRSAATRGGHRPCAPRVGDVDHGACARRAFGCRGAGMVEAMSAGGCAHCEAIVVSAMPHTCPSTAARLAVLERANEELTQRVANLEDAVRMMQMEKKR